jgi:hypothetical protein
VQDECEPANLADASSESLAALREARDLAEAGDSGALFNETLRFCADLLDIVVARQNAPTARHGSWC